MYITQNYSYDNYTVSVEVGGKTLTQYKDPNSSDIYIEGREGSDFEIVVQNLSNNRIEAVVTVDGLSVINGKPADKDSTGYIIDAYKTLKIPGWLVDKKTAAKFTFAKNNRGYAAKTGKDTNNEGVIGLRVYKEYVIPVSELVKRWPDPFYNNPGEWPSYTVFGAPTIGSVVMRGVSTQTHSAVEKSGLSTDFGEATNFATTKTKFTRANKYPTKELIVYYADVKYLNSIGITTDYQRKAQTKKTKPKAFTDYCEVPTGWVK